MTRKGWLCMNPLREILVSASGVSIPLGHPREIIATLGVFKSKKAAQKIFGTDAVLVGVEIPDKKP